MIVILDYNLSNLNCVLSAVNYLGFKAKISNKKSDIINAKKLILPGVGAFPDAMSHLKELDLINVLNDNVLLKKTPILGICLGAQLICKSSEEFNLVEGLKWVDANVIKLKSNDIDLRIPHTGWNDIELVKKNSILLNDISKEEMLFYFNHSYLIKSNNTTDVSAYCNYGQKFTAIIEKDNIFATQFHPEKSQLTGLMVLKNFLSHV